jgi:hypothetical protein
MVNESEIKRLYDSENPKFTLKMFESITKDSQSLRHFRLALNELKQRLLAEAK